VEKWRLSFIRDILARKGVMGVFGNEKIFGKSARQTRRK